MHDGIKLFVVHCDELELGIESGTNSIQGLDCELCFVLMHCMDTAVFILHYVAFTCTPMSLYLYFVPPILRSLKRINMYTDCTPNVHDHGM